MPTRLFRLACLLRRVVLWLPGHPHGGIDATNSRVALDLWRSIQAKLGYSGDNRGQALLQLGTRERLTDAAVCAEAEDRMHTQLVGAANVEYVRFAVGGFVAHRRHYRKRYKLAGGY